MRFPVVLFDLDGTLIDSGPIILASFKHATRTVLAREIPDAEILAQVGGSNLHEQMRRFGPDRVEELVDSYRTHNASIHDRLVAFEHTVGVLERLREQGRKLGIVTAKRRASVELAFGRCAIGDFFDVVVTSEDTTRHKPDPEPLLTALQRLGARPREAAYVGDSPFDVQSAKAAGVFSVWVGWGGIHDRVAIEAFEPDAIVADAEELLDLL